MFKQAFYLIVGQFKQVLNLTFSNNSRILEVPEDYVYFLSYGNRYLPLESVGVSPLKPKYSALPCEDFLMGCWQDNKYLK